MDSTIITVDASNIDNPLNAALFDGIYNNVLFSNLTIKANGNLTGKTVARLKGENLRFENVRLSSFDWPGEGYWPTPFVFENAGPRLSFRHCQFVLASNPGSISIGGARQVFFDHCDFIGARHNSQLLVAWGTQEASISKCRAYPFNDAEDGYFDGRWFVTAAYWGSVNRIYFGENTSSNCAPPKVPDFHANTGEQILIEGGDFRARGVVLDASSDTIRFGDPSDEYGTRNIVTIVGGRGYGQTRMIKSIDPDTRRITLAEPWRVVPDNTSTAVVAATTYRFALYKNHFDGKSGWVTGNEHSASTGVESYGGSVELVVDSNTFTDLRFGIRHWPLGGPPPGKPDVKGSLQSCFFNTFRNNTLKDCWSGMEQRIDSDGGYLDGGILAATFRDNRLDRITTYGLSYSNSTNKPCIKMSVIERNTFNNCLEYAVKDTLNVGNQLFLGNRGTNANTGTAMSISYNHLPAMRDNSWVGFAEEFKTGPSTERPPEQLLAAPVRVFIAHSTNITYSIPVWNMGVAPMQWSANVTPSSSWITLHNRQGTVNSQKDAGGEVTFTINPSAADGSTGTVEVVSHDFNQRKLITVIYSGNTAGPSGDEIIYPLQIYAGRTIRAVLRDKAGVSYPIDPIDETYTLRLKGIILDRWYFLAIEEYNPATRQWDVLDSISIGPKE